MDIRTSHPAGSFKKGAFSSPPCSSTSSFHPPVHWTFPPPTYKMATTSTAPAVNGAYVHLLTNDSYLPGLLVLHRSYVKVGDTYPFVVMVTPGVSSEVTQILQQSGMVVRPVEPIKPPAQCRLEKGDARFMDTWTKLRAFELFDYERVVLRDIDMLLLQNMDDLFELDVPPDFIAATHVCACNPRGFPHYPQDWFPANCPYTCLTYPSCLSHAAPITSSSPRPYSLLNSGVVVLTPSPENARQISSFLHKSPLIPTFKFPDQDFLAELFRDRWLPLPWTYNALKKSTLHSFEDMARRGYPMSTLYLR